MRGPDQVLKAFASDQVKVKLACKAVARGLLGDEFTLAQCFEAAAFDIDFINLDRGTVIGGLLPKLVGDLAAGGARPVSISLKPFSMTGLASSQGRPVLLLLMRTVRGCSRLGSQRPSWA